MLHSAPLLAAFLSCTQAQAAIAADVDVHTCMIWGILPCARCNINVPIRKNAYYDTAPTRVERIAIH